MTRAWKLRPFRRCPPIHAVRGELEARRLERAHLRGLDIKRHFHVIHNEARALTVRAKVFIAALPSWSKQVSLNERALAADSGSPRRDTDRR